MNPVFDTYDCDGEQSSRYEYQPKTLLCRVTSSAPRLRGKRTVNTYLWRRQYLAPHFSRLVDNHNKLHSKTKHFRTKNINAGSHVFNNEWRNLHQTFSKPLLPRFYLQDSKPRLRPLSKRLGLQNQDLLHEQELVNTILRRDRISAEPHPHSRKKRGIIQNLREQKRLRLSRMQGVNEIEDFTEIEDANGRKIFEKYESPPEKPRFERSRPISSERSPRISSSEKPRAAFERPRPASSVRPRPASPERVSSYHQPRAYEPVLQSPEQKSTNVFFNMLNAPLKCVGKFAEMSQPLVTEAIPKMIKFSSNTFKNIAQKVKRNIMGPSARRKPLVRGRRLKRDAGEPQNPNFDLFMSFLVPFLQNPTGFLTSFLAPKREEVQDNMVETRKRRSTVDEESECEVEYKAVKTKIEELLDNIQALLNLDLETQLPIYQKLSNLQQLKDATLETWTSLAFEAQPQNLSPLLKQLKNLSDLRDELFSEIIKELSSKNSTLQNEKWIKILIRLLKLKCLIYNVLEDISSSSLTGQKQVEYLDVLGKLNFTHSKTEEEVLEELKLERNDEIEEQAKALSKLQDLLHEEERHDFKNIKEEAKILWEISNVKKLQRDAILELGKKFEEGVKIGKELRIIFDLQDRLEDCENKQAQILKNL